MAGTILTYKGEKGKGVHIRKAQQGCRNIVKKNITD